MTRVPLSLDTSPGVERMQVDAWRATAPEQKAAVVSGLTRAVLSLAIAGLRDRYPDASAHELRALGRAARTRSRGAHAVEHQPRAPRVSPQGRPVRRRGDAARRRPDREATLRRAGDGVTLPIRPPEEILL
jgi:hypothetical protein